MIKNRILYVIYTGESVSTRRYAGVYRTLDQLNTALADWPGWSWGWCTAEEWLSELHGMVDANRLPGEKHYQAVIG